MAVRQGMGLVTYRSAGARSAALEQLTRDLRQEQRTVESLRCAAYTAEEFVKRIRDSHADILFVLDADRLLFGENSENAPFWINFQRETIVGHSGVQIWWMLPNAAVRFGQMLPDLSRFFLFREELSERDEIEQHAEDQVRIPAPREDIQAGDADAAGDLLKRAFRAASGSRVDSGRIWLELGIPALTAFVSAGKRTEAADALNRLSALIGPPEAALKPLPPDVRSGENYEALARLYRALDRPEDALAVAREAAGVYRTLADNEPAFLPNLAGALTDLANRLRELGRAEEALTEAREAVRISRQVSADRPVLRYGLADSLNSLAEILGALGRGQEALTCEEEAIQVLKQPLKNDPDALLPALGRTLGIHANRLSRVGRPEEALAAAQEAAQIYRRLSQGPMSSFFIAEYAASLDNLANKLGDLGYLDEALAQAQEAIALRRQLAQEDPDSFAPDLANSLSNTASKLSRLNRPQEALPLAEESVRIRRGLANARPDAFLPALAASLNNLANTLGMLNRDEEALAHAEEALKIRRELAQQRPSVFLPDLGVSLHTLARCLSALGREPEAVERAGEAIGIFRKLAQGNSEAYAPELARTLSVRAMIVAEQRPAEALKFFEEAIRLLLPLYRRHPQSSEALLRSIRTSYMQTAQSAGIVPDESLLGP